MIDFSSIPCHTMSFHPANNQLHPGLLIPWAVLWRNHCEAWSLFSALHFAQVFLFLIKMYILFWYKRRHMLFLCRTSIFAISFFDESYLWYVVSDNIRWPCCIWFLIKKLPLFVFFSHKLVSLTMELQDFINF